MLSYCMYCGFSYIQFVCVDCHTAFKTCGCNFGQLFCDDCLAEREKQETVYLEAIYNGDMKGA